MELGTADSIVVKRRTCPSRDKPIGKRKSIRAIQPFAEKLWAASLFVKAQPDDVLVDIGGEMLLVNNGC